MFANRTVLRITLGMMTKSREKQKLINFCARQETKRK